MKRTQVLTVMMTAGALLTTALCGCDTGGSSASAGAQHEATSASNARSTAAATDTQHATSASMHASSAQNRSRQYDRPGFVTFEQDERLWVFASQSDGLSEFLQSGEPAKCVTWIGAGPNGMSLRSDDGDVLLAYTACKPGFRVIPAEGRLWVFDATGKGLHEFLEFGEPAKSVTWIGAGPGGTTLRSDDENVLLAYLAAKPGFSTYVDDGRIWVFETGSEGHKEFEASGEPAKTVTWIGAGPREVSLRSDDDNTLLAYVASKPGFRIFVDDERLWVFRDESESLRQYLEVGEPTKCITLIGAGPRGVSLRGAERDTLDAYLASVD